MAFPQELRQAGRRLGRAPGFTGLAVVTLALGLGAHVAVFRLVDTLFLQPLPLPEAERLVGVYENRPDFAFAPLSLPDALDYRDQAEVFDGLAAHYPTAPLSLRTGEGPEEALEEINGSVVSASYFPVLGVRPAHGRFFLPEEDDLPGAHPVAVVSHRLWEALRAEPGRDDPLGSTLHLNGTAFTVVGVTPEGFEGVRLGMPSEVWIPTSMAAVGYRWCDPSERDCKFLNLVGRLAPGRTLDEARAEMTVLAERVRAAHPFGDDSRNASQPGLSVAPLDGLHPSVRGDLLRLAGLLLAAVTLVVLIAGANLSGLLIGRGLVRRREIAVRLALGSPRGRVVRLFLAETFWLSLAGGAGGLLVAGALGRIVTRFYPSHVPVELGLSPTALGYAALLALLTGALAGAVPGLQASRPSLVPALKDVATGGGRRPRLLGGLLVAQIALSLVLLSGTGLLLRSLESTQRFGSLDPESVATLRLRPRLVGYGPQESQSYTREVVRRLEAVPGVESVSLGTGLAHLPFGNPVPIALPGEDLEEAGRLALANQVAPRFFGTNGIALLRGRDFGERDRVGSPPVVVINRTLADRLWPGEAAVGERLVLVPGIFEVVGVVEDALYRNAAESVRPQVYTAYWQNPESTDARVAVRVAGKAETLLPRLRREVFEVDPVVPVTEVQAMSARLEDELSQVHLAARVLTVSGGLALFFSAVGLFGVLALTVAQRTREIGIRMALGGDRVRVVTAVVRDAMVQVAVALALGALASLAVSRALSRYLYGVEPWDPLSFVGALAALALTAALASWWPARRAARVEPQVALRQVG